MRCALIILLLGLCSLSAAPEPRTLVILGDSLTAGLGLENPDATAYPAKLQEKIDAAGLSWRVVSAGLSGDTTAGGLRRIDWLLRQKMDALILALGGNDGLRGLSTEETRANLGGILDKVRARYPGVLLFVAGMQMPPNLGPEYTEKYRALFVETAKDKGAVLIPFLLEGVGGVKALNQDDGIHPNAQGHDRIAEMLWPLLKERLAAASAPTGN